MANILFITHGTGGDVIPFIKLARILKDDGYHVTIFTHCVYEKEVKENGVEFIAIDNYEEYEERNRDLYKLSDCMNRLDQYLEYNRKYHGVDRIYKEYKILSEYCKIDDTIVIFRHRSSLAGLLAAEKYRCPVASVFLAPNYISHLELHEQLIGASMRDEINKVRNRVGLSNIRSWTEWMCSTKLKIALWPRWYAKEETESINDMFSIGFLEKKDEENYKIPQKIEEFLKSGRKTALITAGTSNIINPNFYKVAVESCISSNINGILVTNFEEFVPRNLPLSILRLHEAPIKKIMPYVDLVIHHGGIGTSSEAIAYGTPQLIMPHLTDGPDNAARLKKAGVAMVFPERNWKVYLIQRALKEIIYDKALSISCRKLSEKTNEDDVAEKFRLIITKLYENREKYKIINSYKAYENSPSKENREKSDFKNKVLMDSISEKKKEMLIKLLIEKRKI